MIRVKQFVDNGWMSFVLTVNMWLMKITREKSYIFLGLMFFVWLLAETLWLRHLVPIENALTDRLQALYAPNRQADPEIVVIDVDERSLVNMAESVGRWPWPRSMHAELVEGVNRQHPKAIVFDVLFSDPDMARPEDDDYFAKVIAQHQNLYFPMMLLQGAEQGKGIPLKQFGDKLGITPSPAASDTATASLVLPLPAMLDTHHLGTHNALPDPDGVVRSYPIYIDVDGWHIPSLPAKVVSDLGYSMDPTRIVSQAWFDQQKTDNAKILLNWHGSKLSHQHVSYSDVYQDFQLSKPKRPQDEFKDKIVIIGSTASGLFDIRATPIDSAYPGVEILATAIENLKSGNSLKPISPYIIVLLGAYMLSTLTWLFVRHCYLIPIGIGIMVVDTILVLMAYLALNLDYMVWVASIILISTLFYAVVSLIEYWTNRKKLDLAMVTFGRFLDPRVVKALVEQGETMQSLSGKSQEITILFSDIRGFTTLSEKSAPEQVVELLNSYFTLQAGAIFEYEGTLDKYIGDAIMAFWGAPVNQPDHALRAVSAAMEMSARLEQFRQQSGLAEGLEIGIGIHSGSAVVGFIGSETKQDYTAIGDTVNLASRIEGQTKGIARILVSEETKRLCEAQASGECPFSFIDRGSYAVKGREQAVQLFEPMYSQRIQE